MSRGPSMPEDFGGRPMAPQKSGLVTAVAVINFVFGAGNLICGGLGVAAMGTLMSLIGAGGKVDTSGLQMTPEQRAQVAKATSEVGGLAGLLATWGMVVAGGLLLTAILQIAGGVGLLQRQPWGRIVSLIAGALLAVYTLMNLVYFNLCGVGYFVFPAVFTIICLLLPSSAADFRPRR